MRNKAKKVIIQTTKETHMFKDVELSIEHGFLIVYVSDTEYYFNFEHMVHSEITKLNEDRQAN